MQNWAILNFDPFRINQQLAQKTAAGIVDCCSQLGMLLFLLSDIY